MLGVVLSICVQRYCLSDLHNRACFETDLDTDIGSAIGVDC